MLAQRIYDSSGHQIGRGDAERYYDAYGHQPGRWKSYLQWLRPSTGRIDGERVYNASGHQIGRTDGEHIYDASGRQIGRTVWVAANANHRVLLLLRVKGEIVHECPVESSRKNCIGHR